jgi:hypothetical protein
MNLRFKISHILLLVLFGIATLQIAFSNGDSVNSWVNDTADILQKEAPDIDPNALLLGLKAYQTAIDRGLSDSPIFTIIDFTKSSATPRLWVFDLDKKAVLINTLVAHGRNSGDHTFAKTFSNKPRSQKSSLGLFLTAGTYYGRQGYSLRLMGLEEGINDNVWKRAVVIHGASYVSEEAALKLGRIGRTMGCPAVTRRIARPLIDTIKGGSLLFSYYPETGWLERSDYLSL